MLPTGLSRRVFVFASAAVSAGFALAPATARAQDLYAPPHVALVDGQATFVHEGESQPAASNLPLVAGDTLQTAAGRLEILFADGTTLDLDEHSRLDIQSPTLFRLLEGRLLLTVAGVDDPSRAARYDVDTPVASVSTDGPGAYRIAALAYREGPATELAVLRGYASLTTDLGSVALGAGQRSLARDREQPSYPQAFNSARFDAFDNWTASIHDARTGSTTARQYLPSELQVYGRDFDRYGDWRYESSYGYVWYPRVAAAWRPYYYGRWIAYPTYGWTWIGVDPWSWPTHHYGRWGHRAGVWFWIPGRTWGPAWVAWASAPTYVAWSPVGFDGRPVFALSIGFGQRYTSWTCVPQNRFGHSWYADRYAVGPQRLPAATAFVARRDPPVAVPRSVTRAVGAGAPVRAAPLARVRGSAGDGQGAAVTPRAAAAPRAVPRGQVRTPNAAPAPAAAPPAVDRSRATVRPQVASPRSRVVPRGSAAATPPAASSDDPPVIVRSPRASSRTAPGAADAAAPAATEAPAARSRWSPQVQPRRSAPAEAPSWSAPAEAPRPAPQVERRRSAPAAAPERSAPAAGPPRSAPSARSRSSSGGSSGSSSRSSSSGAASGGASSGSASGSASTGGSGGRRARQR